MIEYSITLTLPVKDDIFLKSSLTGGNFKDLLDFAKEFESVDLSKRLFEQIPILKGKGKKRSIDFDIRFFGNWYNYKLWCIKIISKLYQLQWDKFGEERYMELYG